jgi:hypothetical protein
MKKEINDLILEIKELEKTHFKDTYVKEKIDVNYSKISLLEDNILFIERKLSNPRNVVKFLIYIQDKCKLIKKELSNKELCEKDTIKYLNNCNVRFNILVLSLIQIIMPEKFDNIKSIGFDKYINFLSNINTIKEDEDKFIYSLVEGLWFKNYNGINRSKYKYDEVRKLIICIIEKPRDLSKIINGFTTYEEKYISMLQNGDYNKIDIELNELFKIVVNNYSNKNFKQGSELIEKVFSFSKKIYEKSKFSDYAFEILIFNDGIERNFSAELKIMESFYNNFCIYKFLLKDIDNIEAKLNFMCKNYIFSALNSFEKIIYYHFYYRLDIGEFYKSTKEKILKCTTIEQMLTIFWNNIDEMFKDKKGDIIEKIYSCLNDYELELKNEGFLDFEDVQADINEAYVQLKEIQYLYKIIKCVEDQSYEEEFNINSFEVEDIENIITHLTGRLIVERDSIPGYEYEENLYTFLNNVEKLTSCNDISEDLINKLNQLITRYERRTHRNVMPLRLLMLRVNRVNNNR